MSVSLAFAGDLFTERLDRLHESFEPLREAASSRLILMDSADKMRTSPPVQLREGLTGIAAADHTRNADIHDCLPLSLRSPS